MTVKRRSFLAMIGATVATPALPGGLSSLAPNLKALGIAHAKKYPLVSVIGISRRNRLTQDQAREIIDYLAGEGYIGTPNVPGTGLASAPSKLFKPVPVKQSFAAKAAEDARRRKEAAQAKLQEQLEATRVDVSNWLRHLHVICEMQGLSITPRAAAMAEGLV